MARDHLPYGRHFPRAGAFACAPICDADGDVKGLVMVDTLGSGAKLSDDSLAKLEALGDTLGAALARVEVDALIAHNKATAELTEAHAASEEALAGELEEAKASKNTTASQDSGNRRKVGGG